MVNKKVVLGAAGAVVLVAILVVVIILAMRGPPIVVVADAGSCTGVFQRKPFPSIDGYTQMYDVLERDITYKNGVVTCLGREQTGAVVKTYTAEEWAAESTGKEYMIVGGAECKSDVFVQAEAGSPTYTSLVHKTRATMVPFSTQFRCKGKTLEVQQVDDLDKLDDTPGVVYAKFMTGDDWAAALRKREYLIVTGFGYGLCDGVYRLDPDRENRMAPLYVQHTGTNETDPRRAISVPFDPKFVCITPDGAGSFGERTIVKGTPGKDEVRVLAMSERDWQGYMVQREIVVVSGFNYGACDGVYEMDAPGSIHYTQKVTEGQEAKHAIIVPGTKTFSCLMPDKSASFGKRDVLYPTQAADQPAVELRPMSKETWQSTLAKHRYLVVTGFNYASCDGTYELDSLESGSATYKQMGVDNPRVIMSTPFDRKLTCMTPDRTSNYGIRDIVRFTGRPDVSALGAGKVGVISLENKPRTTKYAKLSHFQYAGCDGIYQLSDTGGEYFQIEDESGNAVPRDKTKYIVGLNELSTSLTCLTMDKAGSWGSRTIVAKDPIRDKEAIVEFASSYDYFLNAPIL